MRSEALTLIPSLAMLILAIYFSVAVLLGSNNSQQARLSMFFSLSFMTAGLLLALIWFVYWGLYRAVTAKERR